MSSSGPAPGDEFAGHLLEQVIGQGGMGIVYRARNLALDQDRALKVLTPGISSDERFRDRFRRESRLAASIDHPNVIPVHQAGEEAGHLFLAMRLVEGLDLRHLVVRDGPLDPERAAATVAAAAAGLEAAHTAGLIHRDVKPANILVGEGSDAGRTYITDFGISRSLSGGETMTATGELIGTADFMAPEQIAGEPVDHRADVYALGAVLYFALTGQAPFPRDNEIATLFAQANAPRPRPSEPTRGVSPALDAIVERAMAVAPRDRFQSAAELQAALEGGPVTAPTTVMRRPARRRWPEAAAALAVAVVAGVVAVVLSSDSGNSPGGGAAPVATATIDLSNPANAIAVGDERVWVAERGAGLVEAVDRADETVSLEIPVPNPASVAVGFGSVWAVSATEDALFRLDPVEGVDPLEIPLGPGVDPVDVAIDERWVWVANAGSKDVTRVDPDGDDVDGSVPLGAEPRAIATGAGSVWVTNIDVASVSRIDPEELKRDGSSIEVGKLPNNIAVGEGAVWVTSGLKGTVDQIDPQTSAVVGDAIEAGDLPRGVQAGLGFVWVALGGGDAVVRIDPEDGSVVGEPIAVGNDPSDLALADDAIWVASEGEATVTRISP